MPARYLLSSSRLDFVEHYKYIGVTLLLNLSWAAHIDNITKAASLKLVCSFKLAPSNPKHLFYFTFFGSKLEYASPIWQPNSTVLTNSLVCVQNGPVRFTFYNYPRFSSNLRLTPPWNCLTCLLGENSPIHLCSMKFITPHTSVNVSCPCHPAYLPVQTTLMKYPGLPSRPQLAPISFSQKQLPTGMAFPAAFSPFPTAPTKQF